jgi:hypothetical protein
MTSQNPSPQNQQTSTLQRIFSDPVNIPHPSHQIGQRASSDSSAGRGAFESATPLGRRASTNDVVSRPNFVAEKVVSPEESRTTRSDDSTPRAPFSNDARVLEAMEKQAGQGFMLGTERPSAQVATIQPCPLAQAAPVQLNNIEPLISTGSAGPIHTYRYVDATRKLSYDEQHNRSVFVSGSPYELFLNHTLKEFVSQCGEVANICYLPQKGHAFVA